MKYLKLFEDKDWWDENDPFGEEIKYDNEELNFIYISVDRVVYFIRRKNNKLFWLVPTDWHPRRAERLYRFIEYGTSEYFKPDIPLKENIIKRILSDKIEVGLHKWVSERMPLSKLLRISNLRLEDITFLDLEKY